MISFVKLLVGDTKEQHTLSGGLKGKQMDQMYY